MAWTETDPMKERLHFVTDWDRRLYTVTELCATYGVSRKTGFKCHFRTGDGAYCYPLTVADQHSRYLLACDALASVRTEDSWLVFDRLFRDVGLPRAIRTDNGAPFCSTGIHGLCAMNVWWIRLGIAQQRIQPRQPEQNGAHERMHRTLKAETTRPPARTRRGQQRRFQRFRTEYNHERPPRSARPATAGDRLAPLAAPVPAPAAAPRVPRPPLGAPCLGRGHLPLQGAATLPLAGPETGLHRA